MTQASSHIRFRGRSFPVLTLEPDAPVAGWIEKLDRCLAQSPAFFARKAIVIDVAKLGLDRAGAVELIEQLSERNVRVMGLTGVNPSWACAELPPILGAGRAVVETPVAESEGDSKTLTANEQSAFEEIARTLGAQPSPPDPEPEPPHDPICAPPLVVQAPVRSGQSIFYPQGDVTVIGSVSSGADVIAGGSVHVYGTVRGRIMAGAYGETHARIFCRRLEAELIALGGLYLTADEIKNDLRGQAVHAWLEDETIRIAKLD